MLPHHERAGSVSMPIPPEVARSSQFMETLQQTNDRLFEVWRSDMVRRMILEPRRRVHACDRFLVHKKISETLCSSLHRWCDVHD